MKLRSLKSVLLAVAGTTLVTSAAHAAYYQDGNGTVAAAANDDLILSFQETGVTTDLQIDLGSVTQFTTPLVAGSAPILVANLDADLAHVFDTIANPAYFLNSNITFSLASSQGALTSSPFNKKSVFLSDATTTALSLSPTQTNNTSLSANIQSLYSPGGDSLNPATVGLTLKGGVLVAAYVPTASGKSYTNAIGSSNFGLGPNNNFPVTTAFGSVTGPVLYLDQLTTGSGTNSAGVNKILTDSLGQDEFFTIDALGNLYFESPALTPEPSTYALMLLGALAIAGYTVRRKVSRQ